MVDKFFDNESTTLGNKTTGGGAIESKTILYK